MDKEKYRNVSLSKESYAVLIKISKLLLPDGTKLSISKTVEAIANEKLKKFGFNNNVNFEAAVDKFITSQLNS